MPEHTGSILTSKEYAHEIKFISVARALGRSKIVNDKEFFQDPYAEEKDRPDFQAPLVKEEPKEPKIEEDENEGASNLGSDISQSHEENTLDLIDGGKTQTLDSIQS